MFLKGPGELADSITISLKPAEWRETEEIKDEQHLWKPCSFVLVFTVGMHLNPTEK